MSDLKNLILEADDLPFEEVSVPEWKATVFVRALSGSARDDWELYRLNKREEADELEKKGVKQDKYAEWRNLRASLLVRTLFDADGNRIFSDAEEEDLGKKNGNILDRLYTVANKLNATGPGDEDKLLGNSEGDPEDTSPTT